MCTFSCMTGYQIRHPKTATMPHPCYGYDSSKGANLGPYWNPYCLWGAKCGTLYDSYMTHPRVPIGDPIGTLAVLGVPNTAPCMTHQRVPIYYNFGTLLHLRVPIVRVPFGTATSRVPNGTFEGVVFWTSLWHLFGCLLAPSFFTV